MQRMELARSRVVSERVAKELAGAIMSGQLAPGARLRQEDIAADFGASRLPVREALRMLEREGLVTMIPNKGARVAKLDMEECQTIYKLREHIEPLALAESIPNLTDEDLVELEALQFQIERYETIEEFLLLDRQLHLKMYAGCKGAAITSLVRQHWNTTQSYRRAFLMSEPRERQWVINSEHRLLLDYIRMGDIGSAKSLLAGHIRRTRLALGNHPELFVAAADAN